MKQSIHLVLVFVICNCIPAWSQTQMRKWYISPNDVTIPLVGAASVGTILTPLWLAGMSAPTAGRVANGMYDINNNLIFYVSDNAVYDSKNSLIGNINPGGTGTEIVIAPFGDNDLAYPICQNKYNIFTTAGGFSDGAVLVQTVLDMNSYSLTSTVIDNILWTCGGCPGQEFGAIALSSVVQTNGDRYLYFLGGPGTVGATQGQINKEIVHNDGSVTITATPLNPFYPTTTYPNQNAGGEVFTRELDLSPDGQWLGWASFASVYMVVNGIILPDQYRYHFLHLNPVTGDLDINPFNQVYWSFNLPDPNPILNNYNYNYDHEGFRGVEFWQDASGNTKLFMGDGSDGIYVTDVPHMTYYKKIQNSSPDFGFSQIEFGHNSMMYASSTLTNANVCYFNPTPLTPAINIGATFTLISPPGIPGFEALPDQIDGQNYDAIIPTYITAMIQAASSSVYTFSGTTTTWAYGTGSNPWNASNAVQIIAKLIISGNSNLTINGMTFKFSPTAKVIIEKGSSLTLNGATFTSDYDFDNCPDHPYTWQGVEVRGDKTLNQFVANAQGKLTLINSTIKYAQWGARAYNSDTQSSTGGIIIASGSTFRNNNVDVEFNPYENKRTFLNGSAYVYNNRSSFTDCDFISDISYPFSTRAVHAKIESCIGIRFAACDFVNASSAVVTIKPVLKHSIGIRAMDGGFTVSPNSTFVNFIRGIETLRISANQPFRAYHSDFTDNATGILARGINNFVVQQCTLYVGGNQNAISQVGLSMNNGSGFTVEENNFIPSTNPASGTFKYGVVIVNSGAADNQVYKNEFTGLNYGNIAKGINRNNTDPSFHGLQYLCNTCTLNTNADLTITTNGIYTPPGIRSFQGNANSPTGNTFTQSAVAGINNYTSDVLNYFSSITQVPSNIVNVNVLTASGNNNCPSNIGTGGIGSRLSVEETQQLNHSYDTSETAYLNLLYSYNQLMDGGSTNALLTQIQQSWSTDAWVLRNQLLAQSPYLSQTVLRDVANQNILPQAMLLEVCIANPDATKDDAFLKFLQYEIPNPLPQYMINAIVASWNIKTVRTTMESTLALYSHSMATTSDRLLADLYFRSDLEIDSIVPTDTTNYNLTIRYWLQRVQTLTAKYDLIENYLSANELEAAQNILDSISYHFNLSSDQQSAYNNYVYFYNFRKDIFDDGRNWSQLTESEVTSLAEFAADGDDLAKVMVQNVLCYYYSNCVEENYELPSSGNRVHRNPKASVKNEINNVSVGPNPALTYTTFSYSLQIDKAILVISDVSGKEIEHITLKNKEGQQIWDTRNINNGLYYYTVTDGITKIATGKVAVAK